MIDTRHLQHFLAVAEAASFRKAARKLCLSQPALTKSVQRLEESLGEKLFDRERGVEVTPFGQLMQEHARRVLAGLGDLAREAELFRGLEKGELKVGVGPFMAHSIVGPAVGRLLAKHPRLRLVLQVDDFNRFPVLLRQRAIDLFVADITLAKSDPDLEVIAAPREEILWIVRSGHPLENSGVLSLTQLFAYPLVSPAMPRWALDWFEEHLPASVRPLRVAVSCGNYTTLKDVVRHSDAFTGLPRSAIVEDVQRGNLSVLQIKAKKMYANAGVAWLKGRTPSPAASALVAELQRQMKELEQLGRSVLVRAES